MKQIEVYEVLTEIPYELTKYFRGLGQSDPLQKVKAYVTFTSSDNMIFTVNVAFDMEIVNLTTPYGENSNSDHAQN